LVRSLARRWVNDEFEPKHEATIGCAFMSKTVPVRLPSSLRPGEDEDRSVQIHLWDTAGEERFHAVAKSFFRGARGAILVYDITKEGAMDGLSVWAEMVKAEAPTAVLLVVGTKADLEASRGVDREEAALVAERLGAVAHVEVSALTGDGVDEAFELAAQKIASQLAG